jgi:Ras-related protein Rab-1A
MTDTAAPLPYYKVMLLGDGNVGKTSLSRQFCDHKFEESRILTIGVDFQIKPVELESGWVKLSIWDIAGQPQFQVVRESFYKGCSAAALVFDLTSEETLKHLVDWMKEIQKFVPNVRTLVVGNKSDLEMQSLSVIGKAFADVIQVPYLETSAKTGSGVDDMFKTLAQLAAGEKNAAVEKSIEV